MEKRDHRRHLIDERRREKLSLQRSQLMYNFAVGLVVFVGEHGGKSLVYNRGRSAYRLMLRKPGVRKRRALFLLLVHRRPSFS